MIEHDSSRCSLLDLPTDVQVNGHTAERRRHCCRPCGVAYDLRNPVFGADDLVPEVHRRLVISRRPGSPCTANRGKDEIGTFHSLRQTGGNRKTQVRASLAAQTLTHPRH